MTFIRELEISAYPGRSFRAMKESGAYGRSVRVFRLAVRAVKAAECAFIGAKRRALTEEGAGEAQSFGGKGRRRKTIPNGMYRWA